MKPRTIQLVGAAVIVCIGAAWSGYRYATGPGGADEGIVHDDTGVLSREQAKFIHQYHKELLKEHDIDYRTVIGAGIGDDINTFAFGYFSAHDVGRLSASGRGLLLVIDIERNLVRLEVSRALEGVYTDAFVSYIQHRQMIPFFQSGRVADGILASTELMVSRAQEAERGQAFVPPMEAGSAGAGATNPARIGTGKSGRFRDGPDVEPSANDPRAVLAAYREAMDRRNGSPELSIYTGKTQTFLRQWTVTAAQMDNQARSLEECPSGALKVKAGFAVLRYPVSSRRCPPYFFRMEDGRWRLDLTMMSKAIRFNHRNQWHFAPEYRRGGEAYTFAFSDWQFDEHGFPLTRETAVPAPEK